MIPAGLISYTASELEAKAAFDLRCRPDVDFTPPVNVELLVEQLPDVSLRIRGGLRSDHNCEGCVCRDATMHRQLTVLVDHGMYIGPWPGYNAVLAEEYAHIKIHPALFLFVTTPDEFVELQTDPQWSRFEQDAKIYSLAIRMPPRLVIYAVESVYPHIVDEHGFGDAARISTLVRNELAIRFRVPTQDAQRRLSNHPCDVRNRLLNSIQSCSETLIPDLWTVEAVNPQSQMPLFGQI